MVICFYAAQGSEHYSLPFWNRFDEATLDLTTIPGVLREKSVTTHHQSARYRTALKKRKDKVPVLAEKIRSAGTSPTLGISK
jgi:hypothetical protein